MAIELGCRMGQVEQMIRYAYWNSGCTGIVVGVSGGVDSAVAAAFCCRAVGPEKVLGLSLPTSVSNPQDVKDAQVLCASLGMEHRAINIDPMLEAFRTLPGFTESPYLLGNLMARIRMTVLYYHANRDHRCLRDLQPERVHAWLLHQVRGQCGRLPANRPPVQDRDLRDGTGDEDPGADPHKNAVSRAWAGQSDEGEIGLSYAEIDAALRNLEGNGWKAASPAEEKVPGPGTEERP